ncbi:MAG: hypothetical protein ACOQNY_00535 [Mycoplasmoidaceae bacterium]
MGDVSFSWTNFYIFLIEFAFSILFLTVFSCIHYGITKSTKLGKRIESSKLWSFWYFFFFGLFLAGITFVVTQVSSIALGAIGMPLTILGLIYAMTIFYNRSVQIGAIVPTVVWVLYQYDGFSGFNLSWFLRLVVILLMAAIAIATTYVRWKEWPKFLISCLTTFVLILIFIICSIENNVFSYCFAAFISILSTIFYFAVIKYLNRVLTKISTLSKQGVYIDKHYLIPSVVDEYFEEFIKRNNVSQALVVTLSIYGLDNDKELALESIYNQFKNKNVLFIKTENDQNGLILTGNEYYIHDLPLSYDGNFVKSRVKKDPLQSLQNVLERLTSLNVKISAFVSIYGVHSCNLNSLLKKNEYARKHSSLTKNKNTVQLFNTNMTNQEVYDDIAYATLAQSVNLSDITVELELIQMKKDKTVYVCPRFYWTKMLTCNVNEIMNQFEVTVACTLLRYLAIRSLELYANNKQYHEYKLLIYYPIDQLASNEWSTRNLINKIRMYGIQPKQVILSFNTNKLTVWPKQVITNLQELESFGMSYFLVDVINPTGLKHLKPEAIIIDPSIIHNKTTKEIIKQYHHNVL